MITRSKHNRLWRRWWLVTMSLVACFGLAACGPLGGDDEPEPTATSESLAEPTDEAEAQETLVATEPESAGLTISTPAVSPVVILETPDLGPLVGTPAIDAPASTPVFNDVGAVASPVSVSVATPVTDAPAVTEAPTYTAGDLPLPEGDGTSGAVPATDGTPVEEPLLVAETPIPAAAATPAASPQALVGSLGDVAPLVVTSCEPETVPAIALESSVFTTVTDVNIRFGPGADCDLLPISPIGEFLPVNVVGGPVQREGEEFVWVQVVVAGETGWVVTDALEPVAS